MKSWTDGQAIDMCGGQDAAFPHSLIVTAMAALGYRVPDTIGDLVMLGTRPYVGRAF